MKPGEIYRLRSTVVVGYADVEIIDATEDTVTFRRLKDNEVVSVDKEIIDGMLAKRLEVQEE